MKKHKAKLGTGSMTPDYPPTRELTCVTSKKTVSVFKGDPTPAQLLEALDITCRGKGDEDLGLHEIVGVENRNAV